MKTNGRIAGHQQTCITQGRPVPVIGGKGRPAFKQRLRLVYVRSAMRESITCAVIGSVAAPPPLRSRSVSGECVSDRVALDATVHRRRLNAIRLSRRSGWPRGVDLYVTLRSRTFETEHSGGALRQGPDRRAKAHAQAAADTHTRCIAYRSVLRLLSPVTGKASAPCGWRSVSRTSRRGSRRFGSTSGDFCGNS